MASVCRTNETHISSSTGCALQTQDHSSFRRDQTRDCPVVAPSSGQLTFSRRAFRCHYCRFRHRCRCCSSWRCGHLRRRTRVVAFARLSKFLGQAPLDIELPSREHLSLCRVNQGCFFWNDCETCSMGVQYPLTNCWPFLALARPLSEPNCRGWREVWRLVPSLPFSWVPGKYRLFRGGCRVGCFPSTVQANGCPMYGETTPSCFPARLTPPPLLLPAGCCYRRP